MKIRINTAILKKLNPCNNRLNIWLAYYNNFDKDITDFLKLPKISHSDKRWVAVRMIPLDTRVVFAFDCNFAATYVINTAVYPCNTADIDADAAYAAEQDRQIEALIYLIKGA